MNVKSFTGCINTDTGQPRAYFLSRDAAQEERSNYQHWTVRIDGHYEAISLASWEEARRYAEAVILGQDVSEWELFQPKDEVLR